MFWPKSRRQPASHFPLRWKHSITTEYSVRCTEDQQSVLGVTTPYLRRGQPWHASLAHPRFRNEVLHTGNGTSQCPYPYGARSTEYFATIPYLYRICSRTLDGPPGWLVRRICNCTHLIELEAQRSPQVCPSMYWLMTRCKCAVVTTADPAAAWSKPVTRYVVLAFSRHCKEK